MRGADIKASSSYAQISDDGLYRYTLGRIWGDPGRSAVFVMLNPSTADAAIDDRTIGRCRRFAQDLGLGGIHVVNLYAYRATKPADLWKANDPIGPENDQHLIHAAAYAKKNDTPLIVAWGVNPAPLRVMHVANMPGFERATALSITKAGAPGHPLYLPGTARPVPWSVPA